MKTLIITNQIDASGIKIDSKYLVFIIDNSGSMQTSGPWSNVIKEIDNIINTFPDLQGYLIMNDSGNIIHGGSPWLIPSKTNRRASINLLKVNPNKYMSLSNPILGLKQVINSYGNRFSDVGVFIVGDDVLDNNRMENISNSILQINKKKNTVKVFMYSLCPLMLLNRIKYISLFVVLMGKHTLMIVLHNEMVLQNTPLGKYAN